MALHPDLYYRSVTDIDLDELELRGVSVLMVDLDNTLVLRNTVTPSDAVLGWIDEVRARGFRVCIVSNNWHERVSDTAASLGLPIVGKSLKPLPGGFRRALALLSARASQAAVIGDQVFTDVLGGGIIGATTVLVQPLAGGSDLPHTRPLRAMERWVLSGRVPLEAVATDPGDDGQVSP
jgi:HAD superfamily phosphatase (TIGR01668 family)